MSELWPHLLPVIRSVFQPPPSDPIWVWAEKTLRIAPSQNREYAGQPYRIDRAPHTRLVFDFLKDPVARELHIMKSSAAQFSTAIMVGICWHLRFRPCRVLYCINNLAEIRKVSLAIMQPFLRQTFGDAVIDDPDQSTLFVRFPNGSVLEFGSPTEGFFANKQASIIILDEYDLFPDQLEGGATGPLAAARGRFKGSTGFAKLVTLTAPQRKYEPARKDHQQPGTKQHQAYLSGDQREYRITCPGCLIDFAPGKDHLHFEHLRQPAPAQAELPLGEDPPEPPLDLDRVRAETGLRCPSCGHIITEGPGPGQKEELVRAGRWVPTVRDNPPTRWSARYNDTCALMGDSQLGTLAAEWVDARSRSRHDLVQVMRARFAEPESDEDVVDLSLEHARRHCGAYLRGTCPVVPWSVVLIVDCQKGPSEQQPLLFKWGRVAFLEDGTEYVIDYGATASAQELRHIYESPVPYSGPPLPEAPAPKNPAPAPAPAAPTQPKQFFCQLAAIDSGYRAGVDAEAEESFEHHVYPLCIAWGARPGGRWVRRGPSWVYTGAWHLIPMKGRSREQLQGESIRLTEATAAHPQYGHVEIPLHMFNDPWYKGELYHGILAADPGNPADPRLKKYPRLYLPLSTDDLDEAFLSEITSERLMDKQKKIRGQIRLVRDWAVPSRMKNDWGDVLKMSRVVWTLIAGVKVR
jgi:hypothetical protein